MKPVLKPVRWSLHAEAALVERNITREDVEATLADYEIRVPDRLPANEVLMRRYHDTALDKPMLSPGRDR